MTIKEYRSPASAAIAVILFILLLVAIGIAFSLYRQLEALKKEPQKIVQEDVQGIVAKVGALIMLPDNETPTLATVADPEKLKSQPFFAHAKVGDKVLLYANARKAILYDPIANKIVEVAPINIGNP